MDRKIFSRLLISLSFIICHLSFSVALTSCADFLEIKSQNEIVLEDFWTEKADVDAVVSGCYARLHDDDVVRRMMVWGEFRSDNIGIGRNIQDDINLERVLNENIDASNAYTTWAPFYSVINRCNTVLLYAPEVAAKDPAFTQEELQATVAEVSAIRDLCYFYLIRTFRDIPFQGSEAFIDDDQRFDLPATPFNEVLDWLIADLESVKGQAVKRYPTTKTYYQTGRITQDAIRAMLCDMYLWKGDYQNVIKNADEIIESKQQLATERRTTSAYVSASENLLRLNGYPLINSVMSRDTYGADYNDIFGDGSSLESIFELVYMTPTNMPSNSAVNAFYGYAGEKGLVGPSSIVLEGDNTPYKAKYDGRGLAFLNKSREIIAKYVYQNVQIEATSRTTDPTVSYIGSYPKDLNKSNWIIYRLSDVMLMKAEAMAELMTADDSDQNTQYQQQIFSLVNAVNKRSVCETPLVDTLKANDYRSKQALQTLVMQERQRELMFEGKRYYDLVRQAMRLNSSTNLATIVSTKQTSNAGYVRNKLQKIDAIFWPYNLDETKVNANLVQNPAFGSGENSSYEKAK